MQLDINVKGALLIVIITFFSSLILTPIVKVLAKHVGAIDEPSERKVHISPTPRMGGLAIFISFIFGYLVFAKNSLEINAILLGAIIIILLGVFDDIKPIKARYKFIVQIIAASVVVLHGNIYLPEMGAFGINIVFGNFGYPLAIFFIVAIINAINLIDGLDGLAAGISSIYFFTIAVIAFMLNKHGGTDIMLSLLMLGSTLGFLVYNFNPASIFMGDTGSMFLGFIISIIALLGFKATTVTSLFVPIFILFLPILDTILAIFRRVLKGENIGAPDKEHLHHQLLKLNKSPKKTVFIMYGVSILCSAISIFYSLGDNNLAIFLYIALLLIVVFIIFKTDIIFKQNKKSRK